MAARALHGLAWLVVAICIAPIVAAALAALSGDLRTWSEVLATVLPRYTRTTLALIACVAVATAVIGVVTAWLVVIYRFPGSRWLEPALALPLAFPAYVLAYAYTFLLDHPGPVQTFLREAADLGPHDYWFPEIRSFGGAATMLSFVFYPYVYLIARASFSTQSSNAYLAARTLGKTPVGAFLRVALPMARPAVAAGTLLVVMETIADYGTVAFFNVQTFATGIYQAWFSLGDRSAAAQLSLCLLLFALLIAWLERVQRGRMQTAGKGARFELMSKIELTGAAGWTASAFCLAPVLAGFIIPVVALGAMAVNSGQNPFTPRYLDFMTNSVTVAGVAALVTVAGAVIIGFRVRSRPSPASRGIVTAAGLGYAVPGGVIAVGLMVPFAALDNAVDAFMERNFGIDTGLLITGSMGLMVIAYMARFMAAAMNTYDSGMANVPVHLDDAARSLGRTSAQVLLHVHLPLARMSILTALLIVFVEAMKELPATLILHPFNYQTLATQAHRLAADERLAEAAVPSLALVAFGLLPVMLVCRFIGRGGARASDQEAATGSRTSPMLKQGIGAADRPGPNVRRSGPVAKTEAARCGDPVQEATVSPSRSR